MSNLPQSQTASPENDSVKSGSPLWLTIRSAKGYVWAIVVAGFYLCGFLVLNAHLAKFGLSDFEFIRGRYLLAAANFAFFLVCFYLFAGRAVLYMQTWLSKDLQFINRYKPSGFWSFIVFLHSFVKLTFFSCLSAALYTNVALWQIETVFFYAVLGGTFLFAYIIDITNLDVRFYRVNELVQITIKVVAIYVFFVSPNNTNLIGIFVFYIGVTAYITIVIDNFQRYKIDSDRIAFSAVHSVIVLLTTALTFGAIFFGQVSTKLGGGRQQEASLILSESAKSLVPKFIPIDDERSIKGNLIYQTEKYLYFGISDLTVRFRTDDIALVVVKPEKQGSYLEALQKLGTKATNNVAERDATQGGVRPPAAQPSP